MKKFNLIDEPWIPVMVDESGVTKLVSLSNLFRNAHKYVRLAGDTVTQDLAILRMLLSILLAVFSRVDEKGNCYDCLKLNDKFVQLNEVDEDDIQDYTIALLNTWRQLWVLGSIPEIVIEYLDAWHDCFFLFSDDYPFYQVTEKEVAPEKISKDTPSAISGKNINRLISESGNKTALFSPKYAAQKNKEILAADEIARWLLTFHGYVGLSDKVIFGEEKYKASKGWLFDLGALVAEGENLFQTLMINFVLLHPEVRYSVSRQVPCWERKPSELVNYMFKSQSPDNLAELYTNWSRAIYINPEVDLSKPFELYVVKLPEIIHQNLFLEPMTVWRFNKSGENKDTFTPRKHQMNQSMWRSFGLLTKTSSKDDGQRKPALMEWLFNIRNIVGDVDITLHAISMQDDGNATSWVPVGQIYDSLRMSNFVLNDLKEDGWIPRINDVVELTKQTVEKVFKIFITGIRKIRNVSSTEFVNRHVEDMYYVIDTPFKQWLEGLIVSQSKEERVGAWKEILLNLVDKQARKIVDEAGTRDYRGIISETKTEKGVKNIATVYNTFRYFLYRTLK